MKTYPVKVRILLTLLFVIIAVFSFFNNAEVEQNSKILGISYNCWIYSILAYIHVISLYIFLKNRKSTQIENNEKNN